MAKNKATTEEVLEELLMSPTDLSPLMYQYYKGLEKRRIIINDEINMNIIETGIIPLMDFDNDGSNEPIEILIATNGGSVYYGFEFCRIIESLKCKTTIRLMSMAASMGALIAMAGYNNPNVTVICSSYTVGLIHSGSDCMVGACHAIKDQFKFSQRYEDRIKNYIISHSNIDEKLYAEIERQEFWMDSDDMLKYGIVDMII
ncbi:MAG: ATP-dependent Clp protease proteolytic subunit [Candidatus Pacebacteria bacterium]|nr:ATP-dependent Clp protease proteolytic subunit [Candidatus Paceibacterota bacterium]